MKCQTINCESQIIKIGKIYLKADRKSVQRYKCKNCQKTFLDFEKIKRNKKEKLYSLRKQVQELYCMGTTLRDIAKSLDISRATVSNKLNECSIDSKKDVVENRYMKLKMKNYIPEIVFDELETYEHTKLKPISVGVAYDYNNNQIISMTTASFKPRGRYAFIFRKDPEKLAYYKHILATRVDNRQEAIIQSFRNIKIYLEGTNKKPIIITDGKRAYLTAIREVFGDHGCVHIVVISKDLKKTFTGFNYEVPKSKFSFESLLGTMRAKLSRLSRATFIHTKDIDWLQKTLYVYADFWNKRHVSRQDLSSNIFRKGIK
jgi:transposase-like protein